MQSSPSHGMRLRLKTSVSAVKLDPEADRTINIKGVAVQIPAGEVVEVDGEMRLRGLRCVVWGGKLHAMFEQDLLANSEPL